MELILEFINGHFTPGAQVLWVLLGVLVAGHASWHNSYRGCGWVAHVVSVPMCIVFWPIVMLVRAALLIKNGWRSTQITIEDGKARSEPAVDYTHYVTEHTFDFIVKHRVHVFVLNALSGEIKRGGILVVKELAPLNETPRSIEFRMSDILDCDYTTSDFSGRRRGVTDESFEVIGDSFESNDNRYLVVCDKEHLF